jgi:hypothetical protein
LKEASTPCVLWHQPEGGYKPLFLAPSCHPEYKCRPIVTTTITATITVTATSTFDLSTCHCIQPVTIILSIYPTYHCQHVQHVTVTDTQPDIPMTPLITNTFLYQACTKITNIASQDMCINHVPNHVPNHQPVPYQSSIVYHNLYHNKCINHAPTPIPCTSVHHLYHTMYQQCISNIYHITQSCHTPYTIRYTKQVLSMVYLDQVLTSSSDVSHTYTNTSTRYQRKHHQHVTKMYLKQCASIMCQHP